jgi:acyl carrier protein
VLGELLPVGAAVGEIAAEVLDADGRPGAWQGELVLVGEALALGYLHNPALTAERFTTDTAGRRRYATGDRVRRLPDGNLLHVGRADQQVKVRGIRIEPAEIEAVLAQQPGVTECVVVARESAPGELQLVGYVAGRALDADRLRTALRQQLPESLVPAALVIVPALPRLANGKLDRPALPAPEQATRPAGVGPRTAVEARLAALWCGVLKRATIGIHDDFFALGGHSLLATRLIARVRDAFGLEVPLLALFENPTIAGLAAVVEAGIGGAPQAHLPPVRRQRRGADPA